MNDSNRAFHQLLGSFNNFKCPCFSFNWLGYCFVTMLFGGRWNFFLNIEISMDLGRVHKAPFLVKQIQAVGGETLSFFENCSLLDCLYPSGQFYSHIHTGNAVQTPQILYTKQQQLQNCPQLYLRGDMWDMEEFGEGEKGRDNKKMIKTHV